MNALHHAWAESMFSQFRLFFLLHTAAFEQLIVKLLDLQHRQLFQLHTAKLRNDVMIDGVVVKLSGRVSHLRLDINGVPELQPLFERIAASLHRIELLTVLNRGPQFVLDLCLCFAKHIFRNRLSVCIISGSVPTFPPAIFALANIPFAVGASFRHRVYLLRFRLAHTITTSTAESQVQSSFTHIFVPHTADPANRGISRVKRQSVCRSEMRGNGCHGRVCTLRLWKCQGRQQHLSCSSSGEILPASDTVSGSFGFLSPIQGIKIRF